MPKETATKLGCDYFDQHDLPSLNNYRFFYYFFAINILNFFGACNNTVRKVLKNISYRILTEDDLIFILENIFMNL